MRDRVAAVGDLWSEMPAQRQRLSDAAAALDRLLTEADWSESRAAVTRRPSSRH